MESPEVFYTYEWALAVQRAYSSSMLPLTMLAYERDSLVGVAALATGITSESAFFLAASTADYCDFVCSPGRRNEFIQVVLAELRKLGMRMLTLARPARRHFLSQLARLLSDSGWIVLTRLMIGEQPVAWNYGFQFCGSWFWYQPTFDSRLEEFSLGFCLLSKIVSEACDNPEIS